jgi:hypothetical protein
MNTATAFTLAGQLRTVLLHPPEALEFWQARQPALSHCLQLRISEDFSQKELSGNINTLSMGQHRVSFNNMV